MAKSSRSGGVYRIVDVVGVSKTSWEDAGKRAVETAATSLRDLRVAEVTKMDMTVENGKGSRVPHPRRARRSNTRPERSKPRATFGCRIARVHRASTGSLRPIELFAAPNALRAHTLIFSSSSTRATAGRFFMRSLNAV